ncbi:hypothetical protein [Streptomyces prunicolor]|uniref:hypothetical protein n=1 Tax=Streptomyces prunicolor TaxID=67348 RepID=UPI0034241108
MPWDAAELRIADVGGDRRFQRARTLVGGPGDPVAQAEWAPDGTLLAACERTGWWNLHRVDPETGAAHTLHRAAEEFAGSQRLGLRWFAPLADAGPPDLQALGVALPHHCAAEMNHLASFLPELRQAFDGTP